jgi:hypothetical protein
MQLIKSRTRWRGCDENEDNMQNFWNYLGMERGLIHALKWTLCYCVMARTIMRWKSTGTRGGHNFRAL